MRRPRVRVLRSVAAALAAIIGLAACETYLTDPTEGDGGAQLVLADISLAPASVDVSVSEAMTTARVGARGDGGLSGVTVVLRSPSGAERLECGADAPALGTVFDGEWTCDLAISPTAEPGLWRPDSVALRPIGAPTRWFTGAQLAAVGVDPALAVTFEAGEPVTLEAGVDTLVLRTLGSRALEAIARDAFGRIVQGAQITWTSVDPFVVTVSAEGVTRPRAVGRSAVVAQLGPLADTVVVDVPSTPTTLVVQPAAVTLEFVGAERPVRVELFDQFGTGLVADPVAWSTSDPSVATVDATGRVRGTGAGATTLTAESRGVVATARIEVAAAPLPPGFTWTNPAGGRWNDPDNWDRGSVPTGADTARIAFAAEYVVRVEADAEVGVLRVEDAGARGAVRLASGRLAIAERAEFAMGSKLELDGGALRNHGIVTVQDSLVWRAGSWSGSGSARVPGSGAFDAPGAGDRTLDEGRLQLAGESSIGGGTLALGASATIEVEPGTTLRLGPAAIDAPAGGTASVEIGPEAVLVVADGEASIAARLVNRGRVEVGPGTTLQTGANGFEGAGVWSLPAGATWRAEAGATSRIEVGGRVEGSGVWRIPSGTEVNGVLAPGGLGTTGTLRVEGGLRLGTLATLAIDAGGPGASDLLDVDGTAALDGALAVTGVGGWVPAIGDTVQVARWTARTGDFTSVTGLSLGAGQPLEVTARADGLLLAADDGAVPVNQAPTAAITAPTEAEVIGAGEPTSLAGSATDPEDGPLTGASLVWTSSLDGALGTGVSVPGVFLSSGTHEIVLTATDGDGAIGADTVEVEVESPPPAGDLSITLAAAPDPVAVGDTLAHTVTVRNDGPADADSVEVTLLVEGDVLFALVAEEGCGNFTAPGQRLFRCSIGALASGAERVLTLRVLPQAVETLTSTAEIAISTGVSDPDAGDRIAIETTTVEAPALPPLSGVIVFPSDRGGFRDLWQKDLSTGVVTQITSNFRFHVSPQVSPAGGRIAFADNADEVLIVDADGSNERSITGPSGSINAAAPSWTPDGLQLVYVGLDTDFEIVRVPLADTSARVFLTSNTFQDRYPRVSPDGTRIVYVEDIGSRERVTTINTTDGGAARTLTFGTARYPDWAPDGSEIVYSEARAGAWALEVVDATTGVVRVLVDDGAFNWYPTYSPDGAYILYSRTPSFPGVEFDLWAVPADGSAAPFPVEEGAGNDFAADWVTGLVLPAPGG